MTDSQPAAAASAVAAAAATADSYSRIVAALIRATGDWHRAEELGAQ